MSKPIEILRGVVHPWYCDSFGHMNVRWYSHFFDDAMFNVWPMYWGGHQKMMDEFNIHSVTGRATVEFRQELVAGDLVIVDCQVSRIGGKSCSFHLRMRHADTDVVHATYECAEVFFDPATRQAAAMPEPIRQALESNFNGD